jgi:hypothetical protein
VLAVANAAVLAPPFLAPVLTVARAAVLAPVLLVPTRCYLLCTQVMQKKCCSRNELEVL